MLGDGEPSAREQRKTRLSLRKSFGSSCPTVCEVFPLKASDNPLRITSAGGIGRRDGFCSTAWPRGRVSCARAPELPLANSSSAFLRYRLQVMRNLKDKFVARFSFFVGLLVVLAVGIPLRSQPDVRYGIGETKDVMVAMRDGVKLAADIYHPTQNGQLVDGKFPVILLRTPHNKEDDAQSANSFVSHGYVVVLQDVRGRYKSEGHWRPHYDDPNDGFDTAQWIGSEPWCDGGIGTMGSSYGGATQHSLAIGNAPYIKAMVPRNAMSDYGRYGVRHNGAFELRFFNWVFTLGNATGTPNALPAAKRAATDPAAAKALVT